MRGSIGPWCFARMPVLRAARAPKSRPRTVVPTSARMSESVGSQPRIRPFDSPPALVVTMFPIMKPADPISMVWASEIMPP